MNSNLKPTWTVADAKAKLSEVLRNAQNQGPQCIGTKNPCYVISKKDWENLTGQEQNLGNWLLENFTNIGEIELPDRSDPPRNIPFHTNRKK